MKCAVAFFLVMALLLSGCQPSANTSTGNSSTSDDKYEAHLKRAGEQMDEHARQVKRLDEQQAKNEEHIKRFEGILVKWEEQARRYDAILEAMEKQHGIKPAPSTTPPPAAN